MFFEQNKKKKINTVHPCKFHFSPGCSLHRFVNVMTSKVDMLVGWPPNTFFHYHDYSTLNEGVVMISLTLQISIWQWYKIWTLHGLWDAFWLSHTDRSIRHCELNTVLLICWQHKPGFKALWTIFQADSYLCICKTSTQPEIKAIITNIKLRQVFPQALDRLNITMVLAGRGHS